MLVVSTGESHLARPNAGFQHGSQMLRMTKQADYGIVLMSHLAVSERPINAPELASSTHLPVPMVSKILKLLVRAGLLESLRGAKGGYRLERDASTISVADIISALDGPIALTECVDEADRDCSYEAFCHLRTNWQRINGAVRSALESIRLDEMAQPTPPTTPPTKLVSLGARS